MNIVISHSMSATARSCWKKFYWQYVEGLKPKVKPIAFYLGETVHNAFNMYYSGFDKAECRKYIDDRFNEAITQAGPHEAEDYVVSKYTALGMWDNYPLSLSDFEEIKSEHEFSVPLIGRSDVFYTGRIDGLVKYNKHWWVRELKTSTLSQSQFERRSGSSPQATGYVWAARKLGFDVSGIIFDYLRKPAIRKWSSDTQDTFGHRILADYKNRPDFYYARILSYRNEFQIKCFEEDLNMFAKDLQQRFVTNEYYRDTSNCFLYNAECPFYKLCFQESIDPLTIEVFYNRKGEHNGEGEGEPD